MPIKIKENENTLPGTWSLSVHDFNTLVSSVSTYLPPLDVSLALHRRNKKGFRCSGLSNVTQRVQPLGEKQRRQDEYLHLQRLKGDPDCSQRPSDHFGLSKISTRVTNWKATVTQNFSTFLRFKADALSFPPTFSLLRFFYSHRSSGGGVV